MAHRVFSYCVGSSEASAPNSLVCAQSFGDITCTHLGDVVGKVIKGAYEALGVSDRVEEKREAIQSLMLLPPLQQAKSNMYIINLNQKIDDITLCKAYCAHVRDLNCIKNQYYEV